MRRREFLKQSCRLVGFVAIGGIGGRLSASPIPKRLLVIGGTDFVGPAVVEAGLAAGYRVTLFNRGVTNPGLFPYLEHLRGFRSKETNDQNFTALSGRTWDAAVDVWPSDPIMVDTLAEYLKDRVGHYAFVSSGAAYEKWPAEPNLTEDAALREFHGGVPNYSDGKAESERRLRQIIGEKLTIVRPGVIDGYRNDGTNLQTWLVRTREGQQHIGPGTGDAPIQMIDAKDVGRFVMLCIERAQYGAFNLAGESVSFDTFLDACKSAANPDCEYIWIPEEFLKQQVMDIDRTFPLWATSSWPTGFFRINSDKALRAGWKRRSFQEMAADTLAWYAEREASLPGNNGVVGHWLDPLPAEKEVEIIKRWKLLHS